LAIAILSLNDKTLAAKLDDFRSRQTTSVAQMPILT
jgi:phosphoribosylcarboxyaminoimidazole (NCAIR) mutase